MTIQEGDAVVRILYSKMEPVKAHTALLRIATFTQDEGLRRSITRFNKVLLNPGLDYLEHYNALMHLVEVSQTEAKTAPLEATYP